mmetsp:Transcript_26212/g.81617  ORF Transcript_26212/g.81617 Transcript_26212/m.81617 type:complete len:206 (-) Transcript_26212:24-641(-)
MLRPDDGARRRLDGALRREGRGDGPRAHAQHDGLPRLGIGRRRQGRAAPRLEARRPEPLQRVPEDGRGDGALLRVRQEAQAELRRHGLHHGHGGRGEAAAAAQALRRVPRFGRAGAHGEDRLPLPLCVFRRQGRRAGLRGGPHGQDEVFASHRRDALADVRRRGDAEGRQDGEDGHHDEGHPRRAQEDPERRVARRRVKTPRRGL